MTQLLLAFILAVLFPPILVVYAIIIIMAGYGWYTKK